MARRRRRVPEVLWRLFHNRARTLADTIVSLIPPSPSAADCRCKGRRCLGCSGEDAMSFLLRPNDPSDYRKLLNQCFVVISDNAPPLSAFYPDCRWSQHEIVKRTIEIKICERPSSSNLICSGYDKNRRSSPIVELLTCSAWGLLLRRVGDDVMVYLLKYTSIFLPLPRKKHHQVAGFSISDLCLKFSKHIPQIEYQHPLLLGSGKKRKRVDEVDSILEKQQFSNSELVVPSISVSCFGCYGLSYSTPFSRSCRNTCYGKSISREATETTGTHIANDEKDPNVECQENSNQIMAKPKKRSREYSWQRHRKRRHRNFQETSVCENDSLSGRPQYRFNTDLSSHPEKVKEVASYLVWYFTRNKHFIT